jgi:hypothetical protein
MKPLAIIIALAMYSAVTADDAPQPTPADDATVQACDQCVVRTPLRTVLRAPIHVLRPVGRVVAAPARLLVRVHQNRVAVRQCRRAWRQARRGY